MKHPARLSNILAQGFRKKSMKTEILNPDFWKIQEYYVILLIYLLEIIEIICHSNLDSIPL